MSFTEIDTLYRPYLPLLKSNEFNGLPLQGGNEANFQKRFTNFDQFELSSKFLLLPLMGIIL